MAVAVSFSPVPSMAADLVTTADIRNRAVTAQKLGANSVSSAKVANGTIRGADLRNGSVTNIDLHPSARGAKVIRYNLGSFDFSASFLSRQLPGTWKAGTVAGSTWAVSMHHDLIDRDYLVPGAGYGGTTSYRISISATGVVFIDKTGPGEPYSNIRLYRTVPTSTQTVVSPRAGAPGLDEQSRPDGSDR